MSTPHFFFKHAGWGYDPTRETALQGRWRGARELTNAEREARARGWTFEWQWDEEPEAGGCCQCGEPESGCPCALGECDAHEVLGCTLRTSVERHAASLWGIVDPSPEYRRVIEAELASEHLHAIHQALMEAI